MEVLVSELAGAPKDAVVSLRLGSVRRQAKLLTALEHPFRFPCSRDMCEPLKIEVLRPVCSARLVIHPSQSKYSMDFEGSGIAVGLDVRQQTSEAGPRQPRPPCPSKDTASSAKEYFEVHGVLQYVQAMLHAMIQERPDDPYAFMLRQLSSSRPPGAGAAPPPAPAAVGQAARPEERPVTRRRRPASASGALYDTEIMRVEVQGLFRGAAESGSLGAALKAVEAEMLARGVSQAPLAGPAADDRDREEAASPTAASAAAADDGGAKALADPAGDRDREEAAGPTAVPAAAADDGGAKTAKRRASRALLSGLRTGEVGRIIDKAEAEEAEAEAKAAGAAREEPTSACPPAADPPKEGKPGTEGVRMELQGALFAAAEAGELATLLREATSQQADPTAAPSARPPEDQRLGTEGVRMELQGALFAAAERGELATALQEATFQPGGPAAKRAAGPPEEEKLGTKVQPGAISQPADPGVAPLIQ